MKSITIKYISGLGDWMDENELEFDYNEDDTITIYGQSLEQIFNILSFFAIKYKL